MSNSNRQYNLDDVVEALENEYNDGLTIYHYTNVVRLTNGSAAMFINIQTDEYEFIIAGRRYGERIYERCDRTTEALIDTLSHTI